MSKPSLTGLPYYGGKSPLRKTGPWVASLMPHPQKNQTYVEPFAGMLGVLLCRSPSGSEIANDLDGNLVNWWLCVRDNPEELERKISLTPRSRELFEKSSEQLLNGKSNAIERAVCYHVCISQSIVHGIGKIGKGTFGVDYKSTPSGRVDIRALADRMKSVQIENRCALKLLKRISNLGEAVIYCDPPYRTADNTPYAFTVDSGQLTDLLLAQEGCVAISGYRDEWDHLGWRRHELQISQTIHPIFTSDRDRTEVLWTNYSPPQMEFQFE